MRFKAMTLAMAPTLAPMPALANLVVPEPATLRAIKIALIGDSTAAVRKGALVRA